MKKILLFFIIFISLNLYPQTNPGELNSTCAINNCWCYGSNSGSLHIVAFGGQSPYTYSINNDAFQSMPDIFDLSPGRYDIITKDAVGAIVFNSVVITEPAILQATVDVSGQNLTVNATGGTAPYRYWLTVNGSLVANVQNSSTFSNLAPGTYSVSIKDSNDCFVIIDATITPSLFSSATIIKEIDCITNASLKANAGGGQPQYVYSINGGVTYQPSDVFNDLGPGTYTITVKDSQNKTSNTNPITIAPLVPVNGTTLITKPVDCSTNASITVLATAGQDPYYYSIDGGITYVNNNIFNNLQAGTYTAFIKDSKNCISPALITTIEQIQPLKATTTSTPLLCDKDISTLTVIATGGQTPYTYSIGNDYQSSTIFTGLPAGNYNITAKDAFGCLQMTTITLSQPLPLVANTIITKSIDCLTNAEVTVDATGGTTPYTYSIDGGITFVPNSTFTNLTAGTYSIYVKDSNGCTYNNYLTINPLIPLLSTAMKIDASCKGDNSGTINVSTTGGQPPYTYSIGNGYQSSTVFTDLSAGTYNITIKDSLGCLKIMTIAILEPATPLTATIEAKDQTITINGIGGTGIIKYAISPNLNTFTTNNTFSKLAAGIYTVIAEDENGCFVSLTNTIIPPAPLVNGKNVIVFTFKLGQTLADIIIDIPNIKWYLKASATTSKTSKTAETELPLTTVLVEGTTYYASQTINGIESTERLAVTTKSSNLGTTDFVLTNFTYYPNPVKNVLTLSNSSTIDEVVLTSIKGETILTKKINALRTEIDLSNISGGVYFLKVKSEGAEKTVKLIKE
ncbi:T9SS type A sorting domain-containing protein [Flavobacterium sp. 5]|uniref:T9SS type A sorting domain-containing protein n=1 Tax=Flavobacterium sp. 5 TaxID=2035199 RepID=UPI000C2B751A|nr:T9SS type A sorting domain-containing protein [Flavobacterium sp. 5]PKB16380.1 putative secreted protein (Por secretion system target) [Flavobacterium sp. 5]